MDLINCLVTGQYETTDFSNRDARRVWFWRHVGLICTLVLCFFFGAIMSEYVQSLLPVCPLPPLRSSSALEAHRISRYSTRRLKAVIYWPTSWGVRVVLQVESMYGVLDVIPAKLDTSFYRPFYAVSWHLERYYRKRREIARLYTPLDDSPDESLDEDELAELPTYRQSTGSSFGRSPTFGVVPSSDTQSNGVNGKGDPRAGWPPNRKTLRRLGDVWDSREELFAVGEEDESEDGDNDTKPGQRVTFDSPAPRR